MIGALFFLALFYNLVFRVNTAYFRWRQVGKVIFFYRFFLIGGDVLSFADRRAQALCKSLVPVHKRVRDETVRDSWDKKERKQTINNGLRKANARVLCRRHNEPPSVSSSMPRA